MPAFAAQRWPLIRAAEGVASVGGGDDGTTWMGSTPKTADGDVLGHTSAAMRIPEACAHSIGKGVAAGITATGLWNTQPQLGTYSAARANTGH